MSMDISTGGPSFLLTIMYRTGYHRDEKILVLCIVMNSLNFCLSKLGNSDGDLVQFSVNTKLSFLGFNLK